MIETSQVIHADCYDILKDMPDKSIDLVLTDPNYGIHTKEATGFKGIKKYVMIEKHKKYYDLIIKRIDQYHDGNIVDWYEEAIK